MKSPKRLQLEAALAAEPDDAFLQYGLAVQCLRDGDLEEGRARLKSLIESQPDDQIAAYQQLGQSFAETGESIAARDVLTVGIEKARRKNDWHAASEMEAVLESLDLGG